MVQPTDMIEICPHRQDRMVGVSIYGKTLPSNEGVDPVSSDNDSTNELPGSFLGIDPNPGNHISFINEIANFAVFQNHGTRTFSDMLKEQKIKIPSRKNITMVPYPLNVVKFCSQHLACWRQKRDAIDSPRPGVLDFFSDPHAVQNLHRSGAQPITARLISRKFCPIDE